MKSIKAILVDYQNASPEERLHLFLDCRELREAFTAIEQAEAVSVNHNAKKAKPGTIAEIKQKLFDLMPASLESKIKRCCSS